MTSCSVYRAITALLLLAPETPLLFMGQEFASSSPFLFFTDHTSEELVKSVSEGRKKSLEQFISHASAYQSPEAQKFIPDVCSEMSYLRSKLDFEERKKNEDIYRLHKDLLKIRREDTVIQSQDRFRLDGAVLEDACFVIRFFGKEEGDDRLLIINLNHDLEYKPIAEPLLAPSKKGFWQLIWSSDNPSYGGPGVIHPNQEMGWLLPSQSAILLKAISESEKPLIEKKLKNGNSP